MVLVLYIVFCAGSALAEEPGDDSRLSGRNPLDRAPQPGAARLADHAVPSFSTRAPLTPPLSLDLEPRRSAPFGDEFRPRGKSLSAGVEDSHAGEYEGLPTLETTNGWQRLADYKVRGGIRLLTLWETPLTSLSIQAGHGGSALLQWTSRGFGGARVTSSRVTHGLFDRLFSTTLGENLQHAGKSLSPSRLLHPTETATPER